MHPEEITLYLDKLTKARKIGKEFVKTFPEKDADDFIFLMAACATEYFLHYKINETELEKHLERFKSITAYHVKKYQNSEKTKYDEASES